jgi:hypothetical protein
MHRAITNQSTLEIKDMQSESGAQLERDSEHWSFRRREMEPGKLKVVKVFQIRQYQRAAAIEGLPVKSDEQNIIPGRIPIRQGLHLDVDEILRLSLPKVSQTAVVNRGS